MKLIKVKFLNIPILKNENVDQKSYKVLEMCSHVVHIDCSIYWINQWLYYFSFSIYLFVAIQEQTKVVKSHHTISSLQKNLLHFKGHFNHSNSTLENVCLFLKAEARSNYEMAPFLLWWHLMRHWNNYWLLSWKWRAMCLQQTCNPHCILSIL